MKLLLILSICLILLIQLSTQLPVENGSKRFGNKVLPKPPPPDGVKSDGPQKTEGTNPIGSGVDGSSLQTGGESFKEIQNYRNLRGPESKKSTPTTPESKSLRKRKILFIVN